jgi:hypothetical protein
VLHRRAIVFLVSDFQSSGDPEQARGLLRRAMRHANRRHDLIAVQIEDAHEKELPDLGILSLEDAETGEMLELDTSDPSVRVRFHQLALEWAQHIVGDIRAEGVDTLELQTNAPYLPALQRFFTNRGRKRR